MLEKFKDSKTYRIVTGLAKSATFAFALSIVFFAYEVYKEQRQEMQNNEHFEETVKQLDEVRQSLSTRFLGTFPNYLTEINRVFEKLQLQDTVIIFEDVLYYGIKSRPLEFRKFNQMLINHSRQGGKVIVAYYSNHSTFPMNSVFHRMVLEGRISSNYIPNIQKEKYAYLSESKERSVEYGRQVDSLITEKYFVRTRDDDRKAAENAVQGYLTNIMLEEDTIVQTETDIVINRLCHQLDTIRHFYLGNGKTLDEIHFADYEKMYSDMTDCIAEFYEYHGIELIPLNEYLTMSCWLIKPANNSRTTEAILAFPSKYASDEIGFYSQDLSFADYITKMLEGVRGGMVKQHVGKK